MTTDASPTGRIPEVTVGWRIRIARESAGLDQLQLSELTGIARNTISNYELGLTTRPKSLYLRAIAQATGVNEGWLATGKAGSPYGGPGLHLLPQHDSNVQPFDYRFRFPVAA